MASLNYYLYTTLFSGLTDDQVSNGGFNLARVDIHSTMIGDEPYPECTIIVTATNDTVPFEAMKLQLFSSFKIGVNAATDTMSRSTDFDAMFAVDKSDLTNDTKKVLKTQWFSLFVIDHIEMHSQIDESDPLYEVVGDGATRQYIKIHGVHPIKYFQNYEGKVYQDDISGSIKKILDATSVFADLYNKDTDKIEDCDNNLAAPLYRTTESDIQAIQRLCSLGQISGAPARFFIDSFGVPVVTSYTSLERQTPTTIFLSQGAISRRVDILESIIGKTNADKLINDDNEYERLTFEDFNCIMSYSTSSTSIGADGAFEALKPKHIADLAESNLGAEFDIQPAREYSEKDLYRLPVSNDQFSNVAATSVSIDSNIAQKSLVSKAIAGTSPLDILVQRDIGDFTQDVGAHLINVGDTVYVSDVPVNSAFNGKYIVSSIDYRFNCVTSYGKPKGFFWQNVEFNYVNAHLSRGYLDFKIDSDNSNNGTLYHYASASDYLKFKS